MLRYYVYVSKTKVDMLYSQIPPAFLKGAEAELKVNLGVASTSLKRRGSDAPTEPISRLSVVASYLKDHYEVGTIKCPKRWIEGTSLLRWGRLREPDSQLAVWGGEVEQKKLMLVGSSESLIGAPQTPQASHALGDYTSYFLRVEADDDRWGRLGISDAEERPGFVFPEHFYAESVEVALSALPGSKTNLEFLAFVLHKTPNLLIASPIYVALADGPPGVPLH